jgi:RNA polymerase sigma-70 factor (ECF subfamily)
VDDRVRTIERLHRRYAGVLYDKCVRVLGDRTEAEDAVQETFINVFRALDDFEEGEHGHLPWLYRIATNVCLKIIRTRTRKGAVQLGDLEPRAPGSSDPAEAAYFRRLLDQLADHVDEKTMQIVVAHYLDGVEQGEIARQCGISRRAVVKRLTALRAKFGHLLQNGSRDE